jgi:hypothetical protein
MRLRHGPDIYPAGSDFQNPVPRFVLVGSPTCTSTEGGVSLCSSRTRHRPKTSGTRRRLVKIVAEEELVKIVAEEELVKIVAEEEEVAREPRRSSYSAQGWEGARIRWDHPANGRDGSTIPPTL